MHYEIAAAFGLAMTFHRAAGCAVRTVKKNKHHRRDAKAAKEEHALLPQAGAFILSALSAERIKPAPLSALCTSSAAGGEKKTNRRDAKTAKGKG